jgi:hypothetical protein
MKKSFNRPAKQFPFIQRGKLPVPVVITLSDSEATALQNATRFEQSALPLWHTILFLREIEVPAGLIHRITPLGKGGRQFQLSFEHRKLGPTAIAAAKLVNLTPKKATAEFD